MYRNINQNIDRRADGAEDMFTRIQKLNSNKPSQFLKIVYSHQMVNGKLELIPLELYTDGSVKRSA